MVKSRKTGNFDRVEVLLQLQLLHYSNEIAHISAARRVGVESKIKSTGIFRKTGKIPKI